VKIMSKVSLAKEIWIDPHTFGGSPACEVLADLLNQNVVSLGEKHKILRFLNNITHRVNDVALLAKSSREFTMKLVKAHYLNKVNDKDYPIVIKTHLHNVIHYMCHKALEEADRTIARVNYLRKIGAV
jgi:hypothetical protein